MFLRLVDLAFGMAFLLVLIVNLHGMAFVKDPWVSVKIHASFLYHWKCKGNLGVVKNITLQLPWQVDHNSGFCSRPIVTY